MPVGRNYLSSGMRVRADFCTADRRIFQSDIKRQRKPCSGALSERDRFLETHDSEYECGLASY